MLKTEMDITELQEWAEKHFVKESLSLPIRSLQPKNIDKESWLWLYHNGNLTLEQVITRNTSAENQITDKWNIPKVYQDAAIEELHHPKNACSSRGTNNSQHNQPRFQAFKCPRKIATNSLKT